MAGITATEVLRYINRNLGASMQELELNEDEIMEIVFQESLPTFSKYFPYIMKLEISHKCLVPGQLNSYYLPYQEGIKYSGVHNILTPNVSYYGNTMLTVNTSPLTSQILEDGYSMSVTPITWDFQEPNIVRIYPRLMSSTDVLVEAKCVHPKHMKTINFGMREHFLKLCYLDVLVSLYPLRKRFSSLNTPLGNIELFLDQVEQASSQREELLNTMAEMSLKSSSARRIWVG